MSYNVILKNGKMEEVKGYPRFVDGVLVVDKENGDILVAYASGTWEMIELIGE